MLLLLLLRLLCRLLLMCPGEYSDLLHIFLHARQRVLFDSARPQHVVGLDETSKEPRLVLTHYLDRARVRQRLDVWQEPGIERKVGGHGDRLR